VSLSATSEPDFQDGYDTYLRFLDSLTVLGSGGDFTEAQRVAAIAAKYRELARLCEQMRLTSEALEHVKDGIRLDPANAELNQMLARLTGQVQ
jgi:hypothetical protein